MFPLQHHLFFTNELYADIDNLDVSDQGKAQNTATIYAQFNGQDTTDENVIPGCELNASWPRDYRDIYFGRENSNCLYDSGNNRINGQCCTAKTTTSVANPYFKQSPPNNAGTNIVILSILHIDLSMAQLIIYAAYQCRVYKYQRKPAMCTSNIQ
jgi:hypothetical protein